MTDTSDGGPTVKTATVGEQVLITEAGGVDCVAVAPEHVQSLIEKLERQRRPDEADETGADPGGNDGEMGFDEYQELTEETAIYPEEFPDFVSTELVYVVLGLAGETGELTEKLKKAIREDDQHYIEEMRIELGDVLWYWARVAEELEISAGDVADANIGKLLDRRERGELTGEGDHR